MFIVIKDGTAFIRLNTEELSLPYAYSGIEIIKEDDEYCFLLKKGFRFPEGDDKRKIEIKKYVIRHKDPFNDIEVYVYENDKGFNDYVLCNNVPFIFADNPKAPVISFDPYLKNTHLYLKNGQINTNYDCLLLNGKIYDHEILKDGDRISLLNFIFYYYEGFLYMNSFLVENRLQKRKFREEICRYESNRPKVSTSYLPARKELEIEKLKEYAPVKPLKQRKAIFQIGPSITMSMAMLSIAAINVYNNYLNSQPWLNSLVYILMPVTMLLSGVLWPLLSGNSEKKANRKEMEEKKNAYLDYLLEYEQRLKRNIADYLKQEHSYYFEGTVDEDGLFHITDKSERFLDISVGLVTAGKDLEFRESEDEDVNEGLRRIRYRLGNIENCPYFLNMLKHRTVSICSPRTKKAYLMKKFLLELSGSYHYDDFYLAIYSEDLSIFKEFFSLPQLIFNNTRLTLNKKRELQELNSLKLDKPLVLLAYDHIDFVFTNREIRILYFTNDRNRLYKDSEVFIEYLDDGGFIYDEDRIPFTCKEEDIAFFEYTRLLSPYQNIAFTGRTITFSDVFPDLNILSFYKEKQLGLRADFATIGKELLSFDLHETREGPHGLIGGSTGSGKSELIVSLLLSLCVRYRPDYLNIILIDYKGGGIRESLSYKGESLPHIIASIDNLEPDIFERLIVAIDFECKKRQRLFKVLSDKAMTPVMNIDDYLDNEYAGYGLPGMAHLLIVVDEFAELKKENPEIIRKLISFSRIGRSLGVHLLLATQRPSGIIDDEIWSNSHFKIALKVLSDKDSNDIIKSKDAAYLHNPGEFCLAVDDNLLKAKAIYSKRDINNGDAYEVSLLDNRLNLLKKKVLKKDNPFTEAACITDKIIETSNSLGIMPGTLSFSKPDSLSIEELRNKYEEDEGLILGEIDDYLNAALGILKIPDEENAFIFSGRRKETDGILNNIRKDTVVIGSRKYRNAHIRDSLLYEDSDDIQYLFDKLLKDSSDITLVIEDLSCLLSYKEEYSSSLYQLLRRSSQTSLRMIVLSRQSSVSFKLLNCFKHKYAIDIHDRQDLLNIFSSYSEYKGSSFFFDVKTVSFIPYREEEFREEDIFGKPYIEHIPEKVGMKKKGGSVLLGYDINSRQEVYHRKQEDLLISSYDEGAIRQFRKLYKDCPGVEVTLYDKELHKEGHNSYLWIGEGLYNQRLFYVDGKEEPGADEAYYLKGNKGRILKVIDHE